MIETLLAILAIAGLMLAIGAVFFIVRTVYAAPGRAFQILVLLITIAIVGSVLLSQRVLRLESAGLVATIDGETGFAGKLLLVPVIAYAFSMCVAWALWSWRRRPTQTRFSSRGMVEPIGITAAFFAYYVAYCFLPLPFVRQFFFHISFVYAAFIFLALLIFLRYSSVDPVTVVKQALGVIVIGSLLAALFKPDLALQPGYASLIPGYSNRLWGLTPHANSMGAAASALLVLEFVAPVRSKLIRYLVLASALVAMMMSQSKTAIFAAAIAIGFSCVWRLWVSHYNGRPLSFENIAARRAALVILVAVAFAISWFLAADDAILNSVLRKLDPRAVSTFSTGAGRTQIWDLAIKAGLDSPLVGQGAGYWTLLSRRGGSLAAAVSAHNLYLQAFSCSGILGLLSLLVFIGILIGYAFRAAPATRGGSVAMLLLFLVRSLSEAILVPHAVMGAEFFSFLAVLIFLVDRGAKSIRVVELRETRLPVVGSNLREAGF